MFCSIEPLILASASPRRRKLLHSVGVTFEVVPSQAAEDDFIRSSPADAALQWANEKAKLVAERSSNAWVLAADTIVVLEGKILGKPQNAEEAQHMLNGLSGRTHKVITAICLMKIDTGFERRRFVETEVHFKRLTEAEIEAYITTGEPFDKAGAYGIQGVGAFMVEWIAGSYTNVVGLPLCETLNWLLEQRVIAPLQC
jgi:septum formation protein